MFARSIAAGLGVLLLAAAAEAARYCGTVFSGGVSVRAAHLIAVESGAVTESDSTGRFCFADLQGVTATLRIFAIGFAPEERLVTLGDGAPALRVELVPLRGGGGGGWSVGGGSPETPGPSTDRGAGVAAAGTAAAAPPDSLTDLDAGGLGVPLLYLPADSVWIRDTKHKGKGWEELLEARRALHEAPAAAGGPARAKAWRLIAAQVRDVRLQWCNDERPIRNALSDDACAYLDRAYATATVRSAVAAGSASLDREMRLYLEKRAQSSVPDEATWAAATLQTVAAIPKK